MGIPAGVLERQHERRVPAIERLQRRLDVNTFLVGQSARREKREQVTATYEHILNLMRPLVDEQIVRVRVRVNVNANVNAEGNDYFCTALDSTRLARCTVVYTHLCSANNANSGSSADC